MEKKGLIFWFTGLSGSGKTTVALGVKPLLEKKGITALILDGDDIRSKLHVNLGFTEEDIKENNRLIAEMCYSKRKEYDVILVPIISPYASLRQKARSLLGERFYEIYCSADLKTVMARDVKGLYSKAKSGKITNLVGFSKGTVYEAPKRPDLRLDSGQENLEDSIKQFYTFIVHKIKINKDENIYEHKNLQS